MNKLYFYCFLAVVAAFTACKKDNPAPPPTVETDADMIACYQDIKFNQAPTKNATAWLKAKIGEIDWSLAEGHEDYQFLVGQGTKGLHSTGDSLLATTWGTLSFSLRPPSTFTGVYGKTPHAAERFRMYVTAPFDYSVKDIVEQYIKVGPLKWHDPSNASEPGNFGVTFDCRCDQGGGLWYESHFGPQDNQFIECTKKDKRVENGKTYYDLTFRFSVNIYSFGNVLWTTFEDGEFGFTVEIE